jgi:hypothetical protein
LTTGGSGTASFFLFVGRGSGTASAGTARLRGFFKDFTPFTATLPILHRSCYKLRMSVKDFQQAHEAALSDVMAKFKGQGKDSDWAMIRALVHKAVHTAAEQKYEFCAMVTLLSEMLTHAHDVFHPSSQPQSHNAPKMH